MVWRAVPGGIETGRPEGRQAGRPAGQGRAEEIAARLAEVAFEFYFRLARIDPPIPREQRSSGEKERCRKCAGVGVEGQSRPTAREGVAKAAKGMTKPVRKASKSCAQKTATTVHSPGRVCSVEYTLLGCALVVHAQESVLSTHLSLWSAKRLLKGLRNIVRSPENYRKLLMSEGRQGPCTRDLKTSGIMGI